MSTVNEIITGFFFLGLGTSNHNGRTFELKKNQTVLEFSFISLASLDLLRAENLFFF